MSPDIACFNPRPPLKVGATWIIRTWESMTTSFNPRPPLKVGATKPPVATCLDIACFNPRPPLKVGATEKEECLPNPYKVSILAHL